MGGRWGTLPGNVNRTCTPACPSGRTVAVSERLGVCGMKGLFLDASEALAAVLAKVRRASDPAVDVNMAAQVAP